MGLETSVFYTDAELARLLRVDKSTISRQAKSGPGRRHGSSFPDLRLAEPIFIGRLRRWPVDKVHALLGIRK